MPTDWFSRVMLPQILRRDKNAYMDGFINYPPTFGGIFQECRTPPLIESHLLVADSATLYSMLYLSIYLSIYVTLFDVVFAQTITVMVSMYR